MMYEYSLQNPRILEQKIGRSEANLLLTIDNNIYNIISKLEEHAYLENKKQIGSVEEVFGTLNEVFFFAAFA